MLLKTLCITQLAMTTTVGIALKVTLDNKEIITVNSNYLEFAIDHFYKRVSKINVRHVSSLSKVSVKVIATEEVDFELEMASCFHSYGSRVTLPVDPVTYTSFRLKN